jgi:hypothetical protein
VRGRKLNLNPADDRPRRAPGSGPGPGMLPSRPPLDMGGGGFGGGGGLGGGARRGAPDRRFKSKGSRRGLRGRKRSL